MFCLVPLCAWGSTGALQLVAWTGMTVQNARTMDWDTALGRAVAGQQSCMICRLIDDRQDIGETEGEAIVFQSGDQRRVAHHRHSGSTPAR